jgi:hypothetical protein
MNVGVVINPKSARQGRKGKALTQALNGAPGVVTETLDDFSVLPDIIKSFAKQKVSLIAVSGGDGTVQAVQTVLAEKKSFKVLPRLAVLPHGTTNMTAADVGLRTGNPQRIAELLARPDYLRRATAIKTRHTVKVSNLLDTPPQHGMFFGTGAIYRAVVLCQQDIHAMGLKGDMATGATLALALIKSLFSRSDPNDDPDLIDRPYPMTISVDGQIKTAFDQLMFLVTTLNRLILGTRPFWNDAALGTLKATTVAYPHPSIIRYLWPVMYGAADRRLPEPDFLSFSGEEIGLATATSLVIDGELFEPPMTAENHSALISAIAETADAAVAPEVRLLAEKVKQAHGDAVIAVLAYGSCLRDAGFDESLVDLYVLVTGYGDVHGGVLAAAANRLIPPNVYYLECDGDAGQLRSKYAVVTIGQFEDKVSRATSNPYFWARFAQPCALVYAREEADRRRVHAALSAAAGTAWANGLGVAADDAGWRAVWTGLFEATYRTELRPESAARAASIVDAGERHFRPLSDLLAGASVAPLRANWAWRRFAGKALSVARLIKAGFTFRGGADYMAWKISRHSGVAIEVTPWQRRHPILASILMAPKLYRKGGFR